jgi:hypothetical protein
MTTLIITVASIGALTLCIAGYIIVKELTYRPIHKRMMELCEGDSKL